MADDKNKSSRAATGREIEEYLLYLRSPWRVMSVNFLAGVMRGLGAAVGATAVIAFVIWLMAKAVALPVVGDYISDMKVQVEAIIEEARFADDLQRVESILRRIEENTAQQEPPPE